MPSIAVFVFNFALSFYLLDERICSPPFMVLDTDRSSDVLEQIERQGLTFPFSESSDIFPSNSSVWADAALKCNDSGSTWVKLR